MRAFLFGTLLLICAGCAFAADDGPESADPVQRARQLLNQGQRASAIEVLNKDLLDKPGDSDARVLRGLVRSWNGEYAAARTDLEQVLADHPGHSDALAALVNVELWSDHPERAEQLTAQGLKKDPNNTGLLMARVRALKALHRDREAAQELRRVLEIDPANVDATRQLREFHDGSLRWEAGFDHSFEWFSDGRSTWQESQYSLKMNTQAGPLIGRVSHADRFSLGSNQLEVDAYPHLRPGTYGYLNFGYSPDANLYPQYRLGAEIYQRLPGAFEGSAGYRRLSFSSQVNIFTGSLTKYYRSWMFTGRTYITPDDVGTSRSFQVLARRYLNDGGNYLGVRYSRGASVEDTPSLQTAVVLSATSYTAEGNWSLARHWTATGRGGIYLEERIAQSQLRHYLCDAALNFRF
ncbi:MAG TPA: YaiO family outer membrane beta-barrel protein [Candidatus Angelobacter sp.]|nr:YaiO family outer membrane beta-barrel protein [Candidatus Angelobacter sp.]